MSNHRFVNKSVPNSMAQALASYSGTVTRIERKRGYKNPQTGFSNTQIFKGSFRSPVTGR